MKAAALKVDMERYRRPDYPVDKLFVERWSPRAFSGERFTSEELMILFEAARWAPSSYNSQPWRLIYAERETPEWNNLFELLVDFNKQWAAKAAVLVVFLSRKNFEWNGEPAPTHSFDVGAAWENLALQASLRGWVAHGMQGFDYKKAREAMAALGKPGVPEDLPESMQEREFPSGRKPVQEFAMRGRFQKPKS